MIWRLSPLQALFIAFCVQPALLVIPLGLGYSAQAQQITTADLTALPPGYRPPHNILHYDNFFRSVGAEHDLIQQEKLQGKQVTTPTDYGSMIGIDNAGVQAILDIVLPAYHRRMTAEKQFENAKENYHMAVIRGNAQGLTQPDARAWLISDRTNLHTTWLALKQALPEDEFEKLDAYVSHNYLYPRSPGQRPTQQQELKPFPKPITYAMFIRHVANEDSRVTRELKAGEPGHRQNYSLAAHFAQEQELPVRAILLAANRRLEANAREQRRIYGEWTEQYGPESRNLPPPPELQAAQKEQGTIVEQTIDQLKQALGDDSFDKFDSWITKHYGQGQIIGVPSSSRTQIPTAH